MADLIRTTQKKPFGKPGASTQVLLEFHTFGPPTVEFFQIFLTTDLDSFDAPLVETVEAKPTEPDYAVMLDLVAGMMYQLRICPRTTTNGEPDLKMNGEPWEHFCQSLRIVTEAEADFPKPVIFSAIASHATLRSKNRIRIQWESPREYSFYQVRFADQASGFREQQVDRVGSGIGGVFTLEPTVPGRRYLFKVNGLMRHFSETGSSGFTEPIFETAAQNTRSLRAFLDGVDTSRGIRTLMPKGVSSIRTLLGV